MRHWLAIAGFGVLLGLQGCGAVLGANAGSVVLTKKSVSDHVISWSRGKDCSSVRLERGQTFCVEDEVHVAAPMNCYKTIGGVTCYDRPDPFNNGRKTVDETDYNMTAYPKKQ